MTETRRPPRDGVRGVMPGPSVDGKTLTVRLAPAGEWAEIDSQTEGHFLERNARGAFRKSFDENRDRLRIIFQHGKDPDLGQKPIAVPQELGEDGDVPYARGELLDGLPPLIVSGLKAGQYGTSHAFRSIREDWDPKPKPGPHNPKGLPERTIREAQIFEISVVTWPAYAGATAQVRSLSDEIHLDALASDPGRLRELVDYIEPAAAPSDDAGAQPHLVERRAEPVQPTPPLTTPTRSNPVPVEYSTIDEKRAALADLNANIRDQAAKYPGEMPEDEQVRFDADVAERDRLEKSVAAYDANQAKVRDAAAAGQVERTWTPPSVNVQTRVKSHAEQHSPETRATSWEGRMAEYRDDAMRIVERSSFPTEIADVAKTRDRLADLLDRHDSPDKELARRIKFTSAPAYERAFHKFITSRGQTLGFTDEELRGTALAVGVDATGGFAVPFAFDPTIIAIGAWTGAINPYRRACRVVSIVGTDTWNAVTATAVVATRTTEAAAATEQGPTLAQPQYVVKRAQGQITASFEMFQDRTDLTSELSRLINEAKDNEEEASWATGNGSGSASIGVGPVTGTSGSYTRVSTAGAGAIVAGDADTTEAAVPVRHRFRAQWFMNRSNIRKFQSVETAGGKLFGGNQYQAVGQVDLSPSGNTGLRLLGYPVNESPSLPTSTATTITAAVLLNVDQYVIVDRVGLSVQFIPFIFNSSALATGQQALYFLYRNHAAPLNTDSGRILQYL